MGGQRESGCEGAEIEIEIESETESEREKEREKEAKRDMQMNHITSDKLKQQEY